MPESARQAGGEAGRGPQFHAPEVTLRDYIRVVSTRRWLVLSVFLIVVAAAGVWAFTRTPVYRSQALLQITPRASKLTPYEGVYDQNAFASGPRPDFLETQAKRVALERLVQQTIDHFGLAELPQYRESKNLAASIKGLFRVRSLRRTWLVNVTFDWPDPKMGARILDYHIRRYVEDYARHSHEGITKGLTALRQKKDEIGPNVEEARNRLQEFKQEHSIVSFEQTYNTIAADLMARSQAVSQAREGLAESKTRLDQVEIALQDENPAESLPEVLKSPLIQNYRSEKVGVEQDLSEGLKRFGENHPEIQALRAKLESLEENIALEIKRIVEGTRTEHAAAESLLALRLDELAEQEQRVQEFNRLKVRYDALLADFESKDETYSALVRRIQELDIMNPSTGPEFDIQIEERPKEETVPAWPRKRLVVAVAGFLGLALGIGLAFLLENLDTSIKSKQDVARHLGLNVLGYVPAIADLSGAKRQHSRLALPMLLHPRSAPAEAFRSIRTALSFSVAAQEVRHIMVTSSSPGEGKTLVSSNVAGALAQAGKRTLLVDGDMRKPALHKVFETEQIPGLTNLLVGEGAASLEDAIKETAIPDLCFLPCGPMPPNPAELIACERMKALLEEMGERFDRVVIDTPPVINVTDAAALCHAAHGVVFVVRGFRTPRELARRAVEILAGSGGKLLGIVLNNVDVPRGAYYYDAYYRYQDYYYYSEDGTRRKRQRRRERPRQDGDRATA